MLIPLLDGYMHDWRLLDDKRIRLHTELRAVKSEMKFIETDMIEIVKPALNKKQRYQCAKLQVWVEQGKDGKDRLRTKRIGHRKFKACEICGEPAIENERICNPCKKDLLNLRDD